MPAALKKTSASGTERARQPSLLPIAKRVLRKSAPVRLHKWGGRTGFRAVDHTTGKPTGTPMRGLTKQLDAHVFSKGNLPWYRMTREPNQKAKAAKKPKKPEKAAAKSANKWRGKAAGRRRGKAVDAQLSRIVNGRGAAAKRRPYRLTTMALEALRQLGLKPLLAQRGVAHAAGRVASAADVVALDASNRLVVVELKCGYSGDRHAPAKLQGNPQTLRGDSSFATAQDCAYHRHLVQLAATWQMLRRERVTMQALREIGVAVGERGKDVRGLLVYVDDEGVETVELHDWWRTRAPRIVAACAAA